MDVQTLFKVQGPAITTAIEGAADVDFVHCLPCREWPSIAKRWLHRSRCFKWPSSDLITEAIHEGVLLVPVGKHNMIEGRCSEKVGKQLGIFIEKLLLGNIWEVLLSVDLLSDLRRTTCYISKPLTVISEFDKALISLNIPDCTRWIDDISFRSLSFFVYKIQNENCPTFVKNIYSIALLDLCKRKATSIKMRLVDSQHSSNKQYYSRYKQCLFHLLLNLNNDAVSGWLLLAAFFYTCHDFRKMNAIHQLSEEILSRDLYTVSDFMDLSAIKQATFEKPLVPSKQFLKRFRHSLIRCFQVQRNEENAESFIFTKTCPFTERIFL
ncbi:unnamed protein product [Mytilus edulis]|uniref:Mab-21-like HhH/H2TH-like domain-containing protein n=1 Tax=Mytilus edulis TaxID=6550 RepID=A0A8S3SXH8_MYTED|nr:unnamed protein product [Mytilus edulis]